MMLGVILGPLLASWCSQRFFRHAAPQPAAQERETPSVAISAFAGRETHVMALILVLVAAAFAIQALLLAAVPGLTQDHLPVIVISYLLGGVTRFSIERTAGPNTFPEAALTALLLGPTTSFVLTYAVLSMPLHRIALITPGMAAAGLLAVLASVVFARALLPIFSKMTGGYYGAVIATVFRGDDRLGGRWPWPSCAAPAMRRARSSPCPPSCPSMPSTCSPGRLSS